MNMCFTKRVVLVLVLLIPLGSYAQNEFASLGETAFAVNHKFSDSYSGNFALRSRYFIFQNERFNFNNRQLDLVHFSTYHLDYRRSLSFGIQYRFREIIDGNSDELRLTQQFNTTKRPQAVRFGHRFRTEERIFKDFTIFRTRYRFAVDLPLNGARLDVGEAYFIASLEGLLSLGTQQKPEIDQRTTAHIGYLFSEALKLQLGLEYRLEAFNIMTEELLFVYTSAILKL
jgi:hypothetical protein